jgi:hypothetical protein
MASGAKRKTTMAKLNREHRLRERRMEKQAKKDARKLAASQDPDSPGGEEIDESASTIDESESTIDESEPIIAAPASESVVPATDA